jgi:hypothetical protein
VSHAPSGSGAAKGVQSALAMRRPGWSGSRRDGALLLAPLVWAVLGAGPAQPAGGGRASGGDQALALDGDSGYLFAPVTVPDPFTKEATVAAWVNLDELSSAAGHIFHIAGKSGFGRDLDLQVETDNRFHFYVARGAPNTLRSTTVVEPGRWYRVAATYRANDHIALYVNGELEARGGLSGIERLPNVGPLSVGENVAFPGRKLHGRIDEVSFWSRALSDAEVAALWRAPTRKGAGLEASYPLNGDARDSSSRGLHGRLVGGARYVRPGAPRLEAHSVVAAAPVDAGAYPTDADAGAPAPPRNDLAAPGAEPSACLRTPVSLDAKSGLGFSPREALATLHAAEGTFALSEDHLGFFEAMGLRGPLDGRDQATFRFTPSGEPAVQVEACRPSDTPSLCIPGSLTAVLSRGASYSAPAVLEVVVRNGRVEKGFAQGWATAPDHPRVQLVWELQPNAAASRAILHHGRSDAFWHPRDVPSTAEATDPEAENVREAFTAMGGRPLRCSARPAKQGQAAGVPDGGSAPAGRYRGALPPVSIVSLALPSAANQGQGTILMRVAWPNDARATTFALPLGRAAKSKAIRGYRMVGWSAESAPLPSMLAPAFGCGPQDAARWWIVSQVYPNEQGKLTGSGGLTWGPACGQLISCGF